MLQKLRKQILHKTFPKFILKSVKIEFEKNVVLM